MSKEYQFHSANINNDPYNSEVYLNIINYLRTTENELDILSKDENINKYRMIYIDTFLPNKSFWLDWIDDMIFTKTNTLLELKDLFKNALINLPDFEISLKYIDTFNQKYINDEITSIEMREIFEYNIIQCGSDIVTGSEIWRKYQEFEIDLLEDYLDEVIDVDNNNTQQQNQQSNEYYKLKERFISSYTRQLSIPLISNEKTLLDFEQKLSKYCTESDLSLIQPDNLQKKVSQSLQQREVRLVYEMKYYSDKYKQFNDFEKVIFWQSYIEFEQNLQQFSRVQRLYERSLIDASIYNSKSMHATLWLDYISFVLCKLKNWNLLINILTRVLKIFRNNICLWKLLLFSMEQSSTITTHKNVIGSNTANNNSNILFQLQTAVATSGFIHMEEYYDLYLIYCHYCQRKLQISYQNIDSNSNKIKDHNNKSSIEQLSQVLQDACIQMFSFLQTYCINNSCWLVLWYKWCKYYSNLENKVLHPIKLYIDTITNNTTSDDISIANDIESTNNSNIIEFSSNKIIKSAKSKTNQTIPGTEIWEFTLKLFPDSSYLYMEYITWLISIHEYESCRRLYKKMLNLKLDISLEDTSKAWILFEQEYGGLEDIQLAWIRSYPLIKSTVISSLLPSSLVEDVVIDNTTTNTSIGNYNI